MNDLLRWPLVATLRRHRRARWLLQLPLLAVAVVLVVHGLAGPAIAPRNLATVGTWVHYRGLLILAILAAGNLFCTACPMILVRDAARTTIGHARWRWPHALRNKWLSLALFATVLFTYELFDLWSLPKATAWLIVAYFAAVLLVDLLFAGASFCKWICPIGQFSFLTSTLAPTELRVRDHQVCDGCRTVDCINGRLEPAVSPARPLEVVRRGCELGLFLPAKVGNLDCTLCLDCVHACPHDNIALTARLPGEELTEQRARSGIGRLARRWDFAAWAMVFTCGGMLNALAMSGPGQRLERTLAAASGAAAEGVILSLVFAIGLLVLPLLLIGVAAASGLTAAGDRAANARAAASQFAFALLPFGVGVWTAHYGFHLLTGALTIIPVTQSAAVDLAGTAWLGSPRWMLTGMNPGSVFPIQLGCLLLGACGSLAVVHRTGNRRGATHAATGWVTPALLILGLAAAAAWIFAQPMEMRAVGMPG